MTLFPIFFTFSDTLSLTMTCNLNSNRTLICLCVPDWITTTVSLSVTCVSSVYLVLNNLQD